MTPEEHTIRRIVSCQHTTRLRKIFFSSKKEGTFGKHKVNFRIIVLYLLGRKRFFYFRKTSLRRHMRKSFFFFFK